MTRYQNCKHPEERHQNVRTTPFFGAVAADTGPTATPAGENRAAHGHITVTVECLDCGARRLENRNQIHLEASSWWNEREDAAERVADARRAEEKQNAEILTIRKAYGQSGDIVQEAECCVLSFQGHSLEVVIGANVEDAARRAQTADAEFVRQALP